MERPRLRKSSRRSISILVCKTRRISSACHSLPIERILRMRSTCTQTQLLLPPILALRVLNLECVESSRPADLLAGVPDSERFRPASYRTKPSPFLNKFSVPLKTFLELFVEPRIHANLAALPVSSCAACLK